jgi:hypothetical protein
MQQSIFLKKLMIAQVVKKNLQFIKSKLSLPCSQKLDRPTYPEPVKSSPNPASVRSVLIYSLQHTFLPSSHFPSDFPTKILCPLQRRIKKTHCNGTYKGTHYNGTRNRTHTIPAHVTKHFTYFMSNGNLIQNYA